MGKREGVDEWYGAVEHGGRFSSVSTPMMGSPTLRLLKGATLCGLTCHPLPFCCPRPPCPPALLSPLILCSPDTRNRVHSVRVLSCFVRRALPLLSFLALSRVRFVQVIDMVQNVCTGILKGMGYQKIQVGLEGDVRAVDSAPRFKPCMRETELHR